MIYIGPNANADTATEWNTFTELGPFVPHRRLPTPYAKRVKYSGRRVPTLRRNALKAIVSAWRDAGDFLFGAFQPA